MTEIKEEERRGERHSNAEYGDFTMSRLGQTGSAVTPTGLVVKNNLKQRPVLDVLSHGEVSAPLGILTSSP